jgi:hypothetical protein
MRALARLAPALALLASSTTWAFAASEHVEGTLTAGAARRISVDVSPELGVTELTREQLRAAYFEADAKRPPLGAPIALTATGGWLLLEAVGCLIYGGLLELWITVPPLPGTGFASGTVVTAGYALLAVGVALAVAGGVMLPVGLVRLLSVIDARRPYSQRMDEIDARLDDLDRPGPTY